MAGTQVIKLRRQSLEPSTETQARQIKIFWICLGVLLIAFVAGVRWVAHQRYALSNTADLHSQGLYLQLSMRKPVYRPGEPIDVQLLVNNVSPSPIKLQFDNDLEYDLAVERDENIVIAQIPDTIWQLSKTPEHRPRLRPHLIVIAPGQKIAFQAIWPQKDLLGHPVPPGRYTITGGLLAKNRGEILKLRGATNQ